LSTNIEGFFWKESGSQGFLGWLYGEQVKDIQMWVTSSLPSQHDKACLLYTIFSKISKQQIP
jgi:hypothetical protein